jgi:hypothetical protein
MDPLEDFGLNVPGLPTFDDALPPVTGEFGGGATVAAVLRCGDGRLHASDAVVLIGPGPIVKDVVHIPTGRLRIAVIENLKVDDEGQLRVRWRTTKDCCKGLAEFEGIVKRESTSIQQPRRVVRSETIEVTRSGGVGFRSGKGVRCNLFNSTAICVFPRPPRQPVPRKSTCGEMPLDGLTVAKRADFACLGGDIDEGIIDSGSSVKWWKDQGLPIMPMEKQGLNIAVLPTGVALRSGDIVCRAEADGSLSCNNVKTQATLYLRPNGKFKLAGPLAARARSYV